MVQVREKCEQPEGRVIMMVSESFKKLLPSTIDEETEPEDAALFQVDRPGFT
jgi:hypothetical protein